jgi:trk/ktr system potassium uptake protein
MYILIAGGGIAGSGLAQALSERKHDVVVIDRDKERCEQLYAATGVITINGNCSDLSTLKAAGIEKADTAIGALYRDSDNLTFAILAKSFQVPRVMVPVTVITGKAARVSGNMRLDRWLIPGSRRMAARVVISPAMA